MKRKIKAWASGLLMLGTTALFATDYYVDASRPDDTGAGTSVSTAKKTLQAAANLNLGIGDVVYVRSGIYTTTGSGAVLSINKSGNQFGYLTFKNYQNETPIIEFSAWNGIELTDGASYVEINGFEVKGFRGTLDNRTVARAETQYGTYSTCASLTVNSIYNGNGITVKDVNNKTILDNSHHIRIKNCNVHDCGGGGIQVSGGDYITIEDNIVWNNAWYSVYANSGISIYQPYNFDATTDYKIIIQRNKSYGNDSKVKWQVGCKFSDGNGIIIDDTRNGQNTSSYGVYQGKTLVANNITYNNGGSGIHAFASNNVDIVFNVSYLNGQRSVFNDGGIYANTTTNVRILNNIIVGISGKNVNSNFSNTGQTVNYNLFFQGNTPSVSGANDLKTVNPLFINPSIDPAVADFHLSSNSPAINTGTTVLGVTTDFSGTARSIGPAPDRGAYETTIVPTHEVVENPNTLIIKPNVAQDWIHLVLTDAQRGPLSIFNISGQKIIATEAQGDHILNVSALPSGLYVVQTGTGKVGRFVKK
jgi:parallel beta-helix repeat protein